LPKTLTKTAKAKVHFEIPKVDRSQFACPQTVFDYEKKKISYRPHKTAGSLVIILQAGRRLACRQSGFSLQTV